MAVHGCPGARFKREPPRRFPSGRRTGALIHYARRFSAQKFLRQIFSDHRLDILHAERGIVGAHPVPQGEVGAVIAEKIDLDVAVAAAVMGDGGRC